MSTRSKRELLRRLQTREQSAGLSAAHLELMEQLERACGD